MTPEQQELFNKYQVYAWNCGRRLCQNLNVALHDYFIYQNTALIALWEAVQRWDPNKTKSFRSYLFFKIRCTIIDYMRLKGTCGLTKREWREKVYRFTSIDKGTYGDEGDNTGRGKLTIKDLLPDHHDSFKEIDYHSTINKVLRILSKKEREVIDLYYFEGMSFKEIGALWGTSESYICGLHTKIIRRLQECFSQREI